MCSIIVQLAIDVSSWRLPNFGTIPCCGDLTTLNLNVYSNSVDITNSSHNLHDVIIEPTSTIPLDLISQFQQEITELIDLSVAEEPNSSNSSNISINPQQIDTLNELEIPAGITMTNDLLQHLLNDSVPTFEYRKNLLMLIGNSYTSTLELVSLSSWSLNHKYLMYLVLSYIQEQENLT